MAGAAQTCTFVAAKVPAFGVMKRQANWALDDPVTCSQCVTAESTSTANNLGAWGEGVDFHADFPPEPAFYTQPETA